MDSAVPLEGLTPLDRAQYIHDRSLQQLEAVLANHATAMARLTARAQRRHVLSEQIQVLADRLRRSTP
jgi:hypothetical protein